MGLEQTKTDYMLRKAKMLFASGQLDECITQFTIAEEYGCDPVDVWLSRGAAQMALGNYPEAIEDFSRILAEDRRDERANYFRGVAHVALGEYEQGIDDLTSSLKQNNDRGIAHLIRGLAYAELGQKSDADLDINSSSAFSSAEIDSFKKVFGDMPNAFQNTRAVLAKENSPWKNLLNRKSANTLINLLH
jgi:tetratricopeptide (TPR) repeat protein